MPNANPTISAADALKVQFFTAVSHSGDSIAAILPYPPSVNALYATVRGRRVLSKSGRQYKAQIARILTGTPIMEGEISITAKFFRPQKSGDLDNFLKCLLDALTGSAWRDDKQVFEIHAIRGEDKFNPRVEITVTQF